MGTLASSTVPPSSSQGSQGSWAQLISGDDKCGLTLRNVDDTKITTISSLANCDASPLRPSAIFDRAGENILHFRLGHPMAVNVRLSGLRIMIEAELHNQLYPLRSVRT